MNYQRPKQILDETSFSAETITKEEAIKRHTLVSILNEDENQVKEMLLPFRHTSEDIFEQKQAELSYMSDISFVSHFKDIDEMGVEFGLKADFIPQSAEAAA